MKIDDRKIFDTLYYLKSFDIISHYIYDGDNIIICYGVDYDIYFPVKELTKVPENDLINYILIQIRCHKLGRVLIDL